MKKKKKSSLTFKLEIQDFQTLESQSRIIRLRFAHPKIRKLKSIKRALDVGIPAADRKSGVSARSKRGKRRLSVVHGGLETVGLRDDASSRGRRSFFLEPLVKFYDASLPPSPGGRRRRLWYRVHQSHSWNSRSWKTNAPDGTFLRRSPASFPPSRVLPTGCRVVHCPFIRIVRMNRSFPLMREAATRHASRIQMQTASRDTSIRARRTDLPVANSACILFFFGPPPCLLPFETKDGVIVLDEIRNTR